MPAARTLSTVPFWITLMIGTICWGCSTTSISSRDDQIKSHVKKMSLTKKDGTDIVIHLEGPLSNPKVIFIGNKIKNLDRLIDNYDRTWEGSANPMVIREMKRLAVELRNEAAQNLDEAIRLAKITSGSLDYKREQNALSLTKEANEILCATPPPGIKVKTYITTSLQKAVMHYQQYGYYQLGKNEWTTYSNGQIMNIGRYIFRVRSPSLKSPFEETFLIFDQPFIHNLEPFEREIINED